MSGAGTAAVARGLAEVDRQVQERIFITSAVKCHPSANRNPRTTGETFKKDLRAVATCIWG
ncbi:MAG: hypothetical protein V2A77_00515 [Pseudomonadota bacterium]